MGKFFVPVLAGAVLAGSLMAQPRAVHGGVKGVGRPGSPSGEVRPSPPPAEPASLDPRAELPAVDRRLTELSRVEKPDGAQTQEMQALLERALAIDARDAVALRAGASHYQRGRDYRRAADMLDRLSELQPGNAELEAELGHCRFLAGDLDRAEAALRRARDGKAGGAAVSAELARIRLDRHDDRGALPLLDETLALDGRSTELWFTRADVAARLGEAAKAADSIEKGLALEPGNLARRTSLIETYLARGAGEKALGHVRTVTADLPADAAVRRRYAEFLDRLDRPAESLEVWRKVIEADPGMEPAHFRVARLLLDRGAVAESLDAAEAGLTAAPRSARLYLLKAEGLDRQRRYFDARRTLRNAPAPAGDVALLERLAAIEDASGTHAALAYKALLEARDKAAPASPEAGRRDAERGLEVAVRDGDAAAAAYFRQRLAAAGGSPVSAWLADRAAPSAAGANVPGGIDALAFIAHFRAASRQTFFADYSRALVDKIEDANPKARSAYVESLRRYCQQVAELKAAGVRKGSAVEIAISAADKRSFERSEKAPDAFGG